VSFQQLYYTSCEIGLSGYAGYQFNAVTEGTSGETMRAVESLTGYDPPRSGAYAATPEELERCPVNLCFAPGETDIVASVRYVGRDSSRRFGNYFAHALATADFDDDAGNVLPIELWRAPWWDSRPVATTVLPPLAGPLGPGPLSRERVADFLAGHPHRGRLPALLSAAGRAQRGGDRSVLVVAESADEVANWFAAVCYLLPPRWARRLSFSTYLSRPSRSRLHLLGTVPESDLDLGPDAAERFSLFDFPGERFAEPQVHPLARLCVAVGLPALPALWGWADSLADGREATLDDWHPVVAAAAALGRVILTPADLTATASWLTARADLPAGEQSAIARALLGQPMVTMELRQAVRDISVRVGDGAIWEQAQYELLEPLLRRRADGAATAAALAPHAVPEAVTTAAGRVRGQLTAAAEEQLRLATDPADAVALLDWAGQGRLPLGSALLAEAGRGLLGPLLTADLGGTRLSRSQQDQVARAADRWPVVRTGIAAHLVALSDRDPAAVWSAMSGLAGTLLTAQDMADSPLRVPYLAWQELRRGEAPVRILGGMARRGDIAGTDDLLLAALWPAGGWSIAEASQVLAEVDTRVLAGALDWFEATLAAVPTKEDRPRYARLCGTLVGSPLAGQLAAKDRPALGQVAELHQSLAAARSVRDLLPAIKKVRGGGSAPVLVLAREWLAPATARLPAAAPGDVADAVRLMPTPMAHRYLSAARERFTSPDAQTAVQAAAFWLITLNRGGWARAYDERLGEILQYAARWWPRYRLDQVATLIDAERGGGREFRDWAGLVRSGRFAWLVRIVRPLRALRHGRQARVAAAPGAGGTAGQER
jgi:hypothetical protein